MAGSKVGLGRIPITHYGLSVRVYGPWLLASSKNRQLSCQVMAQPSNTNTNPIPLKSFDGIPPISGSERYLPTVPRRVDDPLSREIHLGSLIITPNRTVVSPSSDDSAAS